MAFYTIKTFKIYISSPNDVMSPSPYSLFLARNLPDFSGQTVADIGTGSGIQAIIARLQGANIVYVSDINKHAIKSAQENAVRNNLLEGVITTEVGDTLDTLPKGILLDAIICNPASLPMTKSNQKSTSYYSGPLGRDMIEHLIEKSPNFLKPGGKLILVHSSLANYPESKKLFKKYGFKTKIIDTLNLEFRPFYDKEYIDSIGGTSKGLYTIKNGKPTEKIYIIEAVKI